VLDVPTVLVARTDADSARLLTSDVDERDRPFSTGERTPRASTRSPAASRWPIAARRAYAPYADLLWCETSTPDLAEAKQFAEGVRAEFPGQDARLQLQPVLQLAPQPRREHHREVPARARRDGLQVPVRHARPASTS
jgi:isocitrate lyase